MVILILVGAKLYKPSNYYGGIIIMLKTGAAAKGTRLMLL